MLIVGTQVTEKKLRVDGCYVDGTKKIEVGAVDLPALDVNQVGKNAVLFLDTETNELYYEYEDKPLTEIERRLQEQISAQEKAIFELAEILSGKVNE